MLRLIIVLTSFHVENVQRESFLVVYDIGSCHETILYTTFQCNICNIKRDSIHLNQNETLIFFLLLSYFLFPKIPFLKNPCKGEEKDK